jgi:hypothetical protein
MRLSQRWLRRVLSSGVQHWKSIDILEENHVRLPSAFTLVSCSAYPSLKIEAICSSETSVYYQGTAWCYGHSVCLSSGTGKVCPVYARCLQWPTYVQCVVNHADRWQDDIDHCVPPVANSRHRLRYTPNFPKIPESLANIWNVIHI